LTLDVRKSWAMWYYLSLRAQADLHYWNIYYVKHLTWKKVERVVIMFIMCVIFWLAFTSCTNNVSYVKLWCRIFCTERGYFDLTFCSKGSLQNDVFISWTPTCYDQIQGFQLSAYNLDIISLCLGLTFIISNLYNGLIFSFF